MCCGAHTPEDSEPIFSINITVGFKHYLPRKKHILTHLILVEVTVNFEKYSQDSLRKYDQ
jgi:hypothetical protein